MAGENIKNKRQSLQMTQEHVAKESNITLRQYQRYEQGESVPKVSTAKLVAQALNSTVEELF